MVNNLKFKIQNLKAEWGWTIIFGLIIIVVYFSLRIINLTILPVFADEAIYIRWAQVMKAEPSLRFLPLSVGSPPLFMWLIIPFLSKFLDPLYAGRLLSVLSGLFSMVGIFFISYELFKNKWLSLFSMLLYAIVPFFVFSERLALIDSVMTMFGIWLAALSILLVRYLRLDLTMFMGVLFGTSLMTKSPAIFYSASLFSVILLSKWNFQKRQERWENMIKVILLLVAVIIIGFGIYNFVLRLGPNFSMISTRNNLGIFTLSEIASHPLDPLVSHINDLLDWLPNLLTLPVFVLSTLGIIIGLIKRSRESIFLFFWSLFPLLIESIISRVFTPRYILFTTWPLIVFAALFFIELVGFLQGRILNTKFRFVLVAIILVFLSFPALLYNKLLLTNPEKAPLPRNLRNGHLEEWTSGQGIKEVADYLRHQSQTKRIFVGTEGSFGTLPNGLQMYLQEMSNMTIVGIGLYPTTVPEPLLNSRKDNEVYLVINDSRLKFDPNKNGLKLIAKYPKAIKPDGTNESLLFFLVN